MHRRVSWFLLVRNRTNKPTNIFDIPRVINSISAECYSSVISAYNLYIGSEK